MNRAIMVMAMVIFVASCSRQGDDLPGGYKLFSANSNNNYIIDSDGFVVVDSNVKFVQSKGIMIVGYRVPEERIGNPPETTRPISGVYGPFILNSKTGVLRRGGQQSELNEILVP